MVYAFFSQLFLLIVGTVGVWYTVTKTDYLPKLLVYIIKLALPEIIKVLTNRMDPELERLWRETLARGGKWDHLNNEPKKWDR
jgi:hypothetical protein